MSGLPEPSDAPEGSRSNPDSPGLEIIGPAAHKASVLSFTMAGCHPHDLGTILDAEGVAVGTPPHRPMSVMTFFEIAATAAAPYGGLHRHLREQAAAL